MDVQNLRNQAVDRLHEAAQDGKSRANAVLEGVALAAAEFADRFKGDNKPAQFVHSAAAAVTEWSEAIKSQSVDELVESGRSVVRQSPVLAVGLAVVAGFALSRFAKASTQR